jgi:prepilin signal peptidase PulO-like enzyme (type II secretory pathway)
MTLTFAIFSFVLGASVGSFVNVLALRHHTGRTLSGRSHCAACNATIAWYDLVPVVSFLLLAGRCRACHSRLSPRYLLAECALGLIFVGIAARFGFSLEHILPMLYYAAWWSTAAAIVLYDIEHKIIPDRFVIIAGALALLMPISMALDGTFAPALRQFLAGIALALPFFLIWLVSQGRWMGLGDAKLALVVGWLLGFWNGLTGIMLAFWIGAAVSLLLLSGFWLIARMQGSSQASGLSMKSEIPFAPFIIFGAFIAFMVQFDPLAFIGSFWIFWH